jgi:hypothetical protein
MNSSIYLHDMHVDCKINQINHTRLQTEANCLPFQNYVGPNFEIEGEIKLNGNQLKIKLDSINSTEIRIYYFSIIFFGLCNQSSPISLISPNDACEWQNDNISGSIKDFTRFLDPKIVAILVLLPVISNETIFLDSYQVNLTSLNLEKKLNTEMNSDGFNIAIMWLVSFCTILIAGVFIKFCFRNNEEEDEEEMFRDFKFFNI